MRNPIGVRGGGGGGKKNLKLKSWANFEHKLGKNLRNKAIHLDERTIKGKSRGSKSSKFSSSVPTMVAPREIRSP